MTSTWKPPKITYVNNHAQHCYVINPRGHVEWMANGVNAQCDSPDGTLVGTNDRFDFLVFDRAGNQLEARTVGKSWSLIGWAGAVPVLTSTQGAHWVAPHIYSFHERHLHRYDAVGNLLAKTAISRERFDAVCRQRPDLATLPDMLKFPHQFDLEYHPQTQSFLASFWSMPAWTMGLRLDGTVDWVTLTGDGCCNDACLGGDSVLVHASSCGNRVSFVSPDGTILRTRDFYGASRVFPNDRDGVCVTTSNAIHGFDLRGEPSWTLEVPNLKAATARDGTLYTVSGDTRLEVSAFDIG